MDTAKLAQEARAMVERGDAKNLDTAVVAVVRAALERIAGTYTARAERDWRNAVRLIVNAQQ